VTTEDPTTRRQEDDQTPEAQPCHQETNGKTERQTASNQNQANDAKQNISSGILWNHVVDVTPLEAVRGKCVGDNNARRSRSQYSTVLKRSRQA
jgi:hypothetical protein